MPNSPASTARSATAPQRRTSSPRLLTFHTTYACRHSGACCNAGWIEPVDHGRCRFYAPHAAGSCTIHRARGHAALPQACQQFPRVVTHSPLGISLTLSAFCPTAASLLFDAGPFGITTIDDIREYEGLGARDVMPPLLRGGMLMDWNAVARWEELAVATLSDHREDSDTALAIIEQASTEVCETWRPGREALSDAMTSAFMRSRESGVSSATALRDRRRDRSLARPRPAGAGDMPDSVSDRHGEADIALTLVSEHHVPVAHYFAAHAFACWPMYDGRGILGAVEHLHAVRATLNEESARLAAGANRALDAALLKEAFRQADLRLRHVTSPA